MAKSFKRIARFLCGIMCGVSLCCLCAVSDDMTAQIVWTISWGFALYLSAKAFIVLK